MKIKNVIVLMLVFAFLFNFSAVSFAEEAGKQKDNQDMFKEQTHPRDAGLPDVTVDDMSIWTERKGFEIIGFLQKFIQPFAIVIFIFSAIITLIGALGNGKQVSRGIVGMFISLIMYVVVLYAPEIMDVFLNWVRS